MLDCGVHTVAEGSLVPEMPDVHPPQAPDPDADQQPWPPGMQGRRRQQRQQTRGRSHALTKSQQITMLQMITKYLKASDWKLDQPDWTGRLRITSKGKIAYIKLEDKVSGELFAQAPMDQYPGIAVETVTDSSRYFVIRIQDGNGRNAFIGIGFGDRGDAFDFNVSLQDHFKWVKQETEISKESQETDSRPKLDLGFKEGQTIKLNIGNMPTRKGGAAKPRPAGPGGPSLLPPPPGGKAAPPSVPPPPLAAISNHVTPPPVQKSSHAGHADILLDLDLPPPIPTAPAPAAVPATTDLWGDFSAASSSVPSQSPQSSSWVQF
ncbi:PREDICTED: adaptin ear-binding coat-associated protein 1 [Gekko japonicus]|uniref:Adaptin ear-binding coat-associated protein 1 n=1 Tax=Gekko japonicus TaxID=146911 RepID=A0ABM1KL24_GEKJA|nr:PREDICTED: adaptin ear-binding coat-associated protein 1 [Gekko japonicus]